MTHPGYSQTTEELADVLLAALGDNPADAAILINLFDAEAVITSHNLLKDLDDKLRERWYDLGCPQPERLK